MTCKIFIFGATSAIAEATARLFAEDGASLFLAARDQGKLESIAEDLRVRGATRVVTATCDARDFQQHQALVDQVFGELGGLDIFLIAHGTLPDQKGCERSFNSLRREFEINALGVMSLLTHTANRFEEQGFGSLCVISSVAGDRGRQSNYVYGAAKGAVSIFLSGLRNRLSSKGIHVMTIKPGFVDTPMTREFDKGLLWATPGQIARGIYSGIKKKKDVLYLPWFWSSIMTIIRSIPEAVFKRLKL